MEYKLEIKFKSVPEGWVESLVIQGECCSCGKEKKGLSIYITEKGKWSPGGVLSRPDMEKLIKVFSEHLEKYPIESATT